MLTRFYLKRLAESGLGMSRTWTGTDDVVLWAVPLFVDNVDEILTRAGRAGLPVATWFGTLPVHLAASTAKQLDYTRGTCPRSEWLVEREIHLLTSPTVTLQQAEAAIQLIRKNARFSEL